MKTDTTQRIESILREKEDNVNKLSEEVACTRQALCQKESDFVSLSSEMDRVLSLLREKESSNEDLVSRIDQLHSENEKLSCVVKTHTDQQQSLEETAELLRQQIAQLEIEKVC